MRVLHISSARSLGGGERHLSDLVNALARRGHEMHAALAPLSPLREELYALPRQNIVTLKLRNALDFKSAARLARVVEERQIEIVHAHMARDYPLASFATRRAAGARLILTRHVLFPLHKFHRVTLSRVSRVIAVSEAVGRELRRQAIFNEDKITVIPNGIETSRFDRGARDFSREAYRQKINTRASLLVGTIGHIAPIKGHEEFVRAAALIALHRSDVDFVIVGEDKSHTKEHRARLENLIAELNLGERVHLLGWFDDVASVLFALDVFVSAARAEPFGLAIIEAMASGLSLVATKSEGACEIIEDEVTGKLVPIGDTEALACAIDGLLDDAEMRQRLGAHAQHAARKHFSLDRMVTATEQIYREAITKG